MDGWGVYLDAFLDEGDQLWQCCAALPDDDAEIVPFDHEIDHRDVAFISEAALGEGREVPHVDVGQGSCEVHGRDRFCEILEEGVVDVERFAPVHISRMDVGSLIPNCQHGEDLQKGRQARRVLFDQLLNRSCNKSKGRCCIQWDVVACFFVHGDEALC